MERLKVYWTQRSTLVVQQLDFNTVLTVYQCKLFNPYDYRRNNYLFFVKLGKYYLIATESGHILQKYSKIAKPKNINAATKQLHFDTC